MVLFPAPFSPSSASTSPLAYGEGYIFVGNDLCKVFGHMPHFYNGNSHIFPPASLDSLLACFFEQASRQDETLYVGIPSINKGKHACQRAFEALLSFSPWRAPARLRLENQKSLGNPSLAGAKHFCAAKPCLLMSIDGNERA